MPRLFLPLAAATTVLLAGAAKAEDHWLIVGGGPTAANSQLSLESNVQFVQRLLGRTKPAPAKVDVYFAAGRNGARDVQYRPEDGASRFDAHRLLARLEGEGEGLALRYRQNRISDVDGPATAGRVQRWFATTGALLQPEDRLFLYFTGHGASGGDEQPKNTEIYFWRNQRMSVRRFTQRLDKIHPDVPVVLVMVQCYSGGFANVIFEGGDPKAALADANRAGFFSTVHDRPAAGCTPALKKKGYQEYSGVFWAALSGRTRAKEEIDQPDPSGDGTTSLAEAHAYAQLRADTIDIGVRTSGALLRRYSRLSGGGEGGLSRRSPYRALARAATPAQKAILDGLSEQLELARTRRLAEAKEQAKTLEARRRRIQEKRNNKAKRARRLRSTIRADLHRKWPELNHGFHPRITELLSASPEKVVRAITNHEKFRDWQSVRRRLDRLDQRDRALEREWAKAKRFIRVAENVILRANLGAVASEEVRKRFEELLAAERTTLAGS